MRWTDRLRPPVAGVLVLALFAGCTHVRYQAEGAADAEEETPFDRTVTYHVAREFYADPPRCVVVLPVSATSATGDRRRHRRIEAAVARHLSSRLEQVIGPLRRDRLVSELAIDLGSPAGRRRFATATRCGASVAIETRGLETTYALIWAHAGLGLTLEMRRARDDAVLWRAAHRAARSEGTLPLSPFSVPIGAFSAGRFASDSEVFPSMVEDAARRIVASLPDTRALFGRGHASR